MEDRVEMLLFGEVIREMLFFGEEIRFIDRFLAKYSADFLVCESALVGILGTSSSLGTGEPK